MPTVPPADATSGVQQRPILIGIDQARPSQTDRILAACKLVRAVRWNPDTSAVAAQTACSRAGWHTVARGVCHVTTSCSCVDAPGGAQAVLALPERGEVAALQMLLELRKWCDGVAPLRNLWLQHTIDVLVQGALLRGELRRAAELVEQQRAVLEATDGPSDATWHSELVGARLTEPGREPETTPLAAEAPLRMRTCWCSRGGGRNCSYSVAS